MAWCTQDDLGLDVATLHAEVDRERRHAFSVAALGVPSIYIQTRGDHMERTLPTHATTVHASTYGQAAAGVEKKTPAYRGSRASRQGGIWEMRQGWRG